MHQHITARDPNHLAGSRSGFKIVFLTLIVSISKGDGNVLYLCQALKLLEKSTINFLFCLNMFINCEEHLCSRFQQWITKPKRTLLLSCTSWYQYYKFSFRLYGIILNLNANLPFFKVLSAVKIFYILRSWKSWTSSLRRQKVVAFKNIWSIFVWILTGPPNHIVIWICHLKIF